MTAAFSGRSSSRLPAAILAGVIEIAAVFVLISGLSASGVIGQQVALPSIFNLAPSPSPTPPPPPPPQKHHVKVVGKSAAAGVKARASPVLAAPTVVPVFPIIAATTPAAGTQSLNGAAASGEGSGVGGAGDGTGSGGQGQGDGSGGAEAELASGRIKDSDYPYEGIGQRARGVVRISMAIDARGRATGCQIMRTSGFRILDDLTCRLALNRFHFRPARDASGRAIAGSITYDHQWLLGDVELPG